MTINVTTHEATTKFPELLQRVLHGEEIVIADEGAEVARVVPTFSTTRSINQPRVPGIDKGRLVVPDDFNDPLPDDVLRAFEGS